MSIQSVDILTEAILENNLEKVKEITEDYWGFYPVLNTCEYYLLAAKLGYEDIFKQMIISDTGMEICELSPGSWKEAYEPCIGVAAKAGHLCILKILFQYRDVPKYSIVKEHIYGWEEYGYPADYDAIRSFLKEQAKDYECVCEHCECKASWYLNPRDCPRGTCKCICIVSLLV